MPRPRATRPSSPPSAWTRRAVSWRRSPGVRSAVLQVIATAQVFLEPFLFTGGGPNNATTTLAVLSYREAFISNNLGSGAAVTTIWMLLMVVVIFLYNRFMGIGNLD